MRDVQSEQRSLWARIMALEVERKRHDGTNECKGCKPADVVILPPISTEKAVGAVLNDELSDATGVGYYGEYYEKDD